VPEIPWDDPSTAPLWAAAHERRLLLQRCDACGHHQHHPRPHCTACGRLEPSWVDAAGGGTVYAVTEVHIPVVDWLTPPYRCALVDLDEGPRLPIFRPEPS
jgi:uncharacterized protein